MTNKLSNTKIIPTERMKSMKTTTQKIVFASMLAALICVATMIIKIPSPLKGYINLGDGFVLLAAWILSPAYGFMSTAVGSALADIFSGYLIYAPATFVIKGLMALTAYFIYKKLSKNSYSIIKRIISAILAEILMIGGYFVFEGFLYGFGASLVNIPANAVQGVAGIIVGVILIKFFEKNKILH